MPDCKPVFIFALPRSGSTLLMRLLNRCFDEKGRPVVIRGENRCIVQPLKRILETFDYVERMGQNASLEALENTGRFPSVWNVLPNRNSLRSWAQTALSLFLNVRTSGPFGFKETNIGTGTLEDLESTIAFCRELFPDVVIWHHLRARADVIASMEKCPPHWYGPPEKIRLRTSRQMKNLQSANHDAESWYSDLMTYDDFSAKIAGPGMTIEREKYDEVMTLKLK